MAMLMRSSLARTAQATSTKKRSFCTSARPQQVATLPDLPYDYGALEPVVIGDIMELHHKKHHNAYVTNYNASMDQLDSAKSQGKIDKMIALQPALKFNGGGHINHSIFWTNLCPPKDFAPPSDAMIKELETTFGTFDNFKATMSAKTAAVQGSGWGWLGYDKTANKLAIATCANQDPLEPTTGLVPLLGFDVWEHAYYLQYKNVRPDYVKELWKIVNWKNVEERLHNARQN
mmetsp:Transcript_7675/g.8441  ORF Transcript_7675/g.8441 Transcript_7675/m.8441 type:complete len:232 (-) Transcript_7675:187-882(-)